MYLPLVFILPSLAAIATILLFRAMQWKETTQRARAQLEEEVRQRTAELVAAREKLQTEFAQRIKVEEALREEHRRLRQALAMSDRDRQLLAYEIHDGFVQPATAALMNLQAALSAYATDPDKALENVVRGVQSLQESISQVRRLISGLRPAVLEDQGLVAAVDKLVCDTESRTEIPIGWSHQVHLDRLAPTLETSLFRIIQEALRNAVRHSEADRIEIALTQANGTVEVTVRDSGRGFDPLLFAETDFANPDGSAIFSLLRADPEPYVVALSEALAKACKSDMESLERLEVVLAGIVAAPSEAEEGSDSPR